ncbi:inner membrane complex protein 1k, putative [Hepatocystis sp. ex Piliocolobus tephrosceles]|nr:inner membrane complex protein 1k, putative [Hepatocystis sp. ex Piliocolobus tephrosceles]
MDSSSEGSYENDVANYYNTRKTEYINEYDQNENVNAIEEYTGTHKNTNVSKKEGTENTSSDDFNSESSYLPQYIPELHGLGRKHQALPYTVNEYGIPGQVSPYHKPKDLGETGERSKNEILYDENGMRITVNSEMDKNKDKLWSWTKEGKLKVECSQPIIPVSVVQDILRRDKIVLVPQVEVTDVVVPKVFNQSVKHDIPKVNIHANTTNVDIPNVTYVDKEVIVPIITGYTHKFVPKWEIHEVPRPVVKYIGEQKIVELEVPEIKYVDKIVEREVVVDTVEKRVPKIIEVPEYVDEVKYVWKPIEKIVYIQKLVPKFDVDLQCPPPLIVPFPVQKVKQIPPIMLKKVTKIPEYIHNDTNKPGGYMPVSQEYVNQFTKKQNNTLPNYMFTACCDPNVQDPNNSKKCNDENITSDLFMNVQDENVIKSEANIGNDLKSFVNNNHGFDKNENEQLTVDVNA